MDGVYDSRDVAAYIAQQCQELGLSYTNTKIQKLTYCVYGTMLAWKNRVVCNEAPKAWDYGPVFPKVFKHIYKKNEIADFSNDVANSNDVDLKNAVKAVLNHFGDWTASSLSAWTHLEGSPWWKVIKEQESGWNSLIPDEYISTYFKENVLASR